MRECVIRGSQESVRRFAEWLWIGAAGTRSPTHQDANLNAFAQLEGRKRFWLWPPEARAMLGGWPRWTRQCNFAAADPSQERWRDAAAADLVVDLEPGDVLCIPAMWWHHVEALSDGVGLNTWWSSGTAHPSALM